jgi:hypothetical protein
MVEEGAFREHGFGLDCMVRPLQLRSAMGEESDAQGKLGWGLERGSGRHGALARGATWTLKLGSDSECQNRRVLPVT